MTPSTGKKQNKARTAKREELAKNKFERLLKWALGAIRNHSKVLISTGSLLISIAGAVFRFKFWLLTLGIALVVLPFIARIPAERGKLQLALFLVVVSSALAVFLVAVVDNQSTGDPLLPTPFQAATTRAYINVINAQFDTLKVGSIPTMRWTVMNTGETPAMKYSVSYRFRLTKTLLPEHVAALNHGPADSGGVMPARVPWRQHHDFGGQRLSAVDLEAIESGKVTLYFYGVVIYRDVFDKQHYTEFCYYYDPRLCLTKTCSRFVTGT